MVISPSLILRIQFLLFLFSFPLHGVTQNFDLSELLDEDRQSGIEINEHFRSLAIDNANELQRTKNSSLAQRRIQDITQRIEACKQFGAWYTLLLNRISYQEFQTVFANLKPSFSQSRSDTIETKDLLGFTLGDHLNKWENSITFFKNEGDETIYKYNSKLLFNQTVTNEVLLIFKKNVLFGVVVMFIPPIRVKDIEGITVSSVDKLCHETLGFYGEFVKLFHLPNEIIMEQNILVSLSWQLKYAYCGLVTNYYGADKDAEISLIMIETINKY